MEISQKQWKKSIDYVKIYFLKASWAARAVSRATRAVSGLAHAWLRACSSGFEEAIE